MKKQLLLLFLWLFVGVVSVHASGKPIVIQGHVSGSKMDTILLRSPVGIVNFVDYNPTVQTVGKAYPDTGGNFRIMVDADLDGQYFSLIMGEIYPFNYVYLYPGDSIFVEVNDKESVYTGGAASAAEYEDSCHERRYVMDFQAFKRKPDDFYQYIDSAAENQNHFIERFAKKNNWGLKRKEQALADAYYFWKADKYNYITVHGYALRTNETVKVDPAWFNFLSPKDLNCATCLGLSNYYSILRNLPSVISSERFSQLTVEQRKEYLDRQTLWHMKSEIRIIDSLFSGVNKEIAIGMYLEGAFYSIERYKKDIKTFALHQMDSLIATMKPDTYHTGLYARLMEKRSRIIDRTNTPAYAFNLPDTAGKIHSLNDFKGKVVLLDFWEVGCVPCIHAVPYADKIQDSLKGTDFKMVSVCCHSDDKYWKIFINKFNWQGLQLSSHDKSEEQYGVSGYPHYVLVDKKGIIRDPDASLESDALKIEISELLKK